MHVSDGKVTITQSQALENGGSGGVGRFLGPRTGDEGSPHKKWHTERHGLCSFGAEGSSGARLERFAGRCCPCSNAASHIFKANVCLVFPRKCIFLLGPT